MVMKHIIKLNGKPIEQATQDELNDLEKSIAEAFYKNFGFVIPVNTTYPRSVREQES